MLAGECCLCGKPQNIHFFREKAYNNNSKFENNPYGFWTWELSKYEETKKLKLGIV